MIETRKLSIDDPQAISTAKHILQAGGLVAFPTDTIYGLAANVFNPDAIKNIFSVKQRPEEKALPVLIGEYSHLDDLVLTVDNRMRRIAAAFWPGALTMVLLKGPNVPVELSPYPTIGVRMPNLAFTLELLKATGPLATTSANLSRGANPVNAAAVMAQLGGLVDLILDGGPTPGQTASTVVDLTEPEMKILRPGSIALADLMSLFNQV